MINNRSRFRGTTGLGDAGRARYPRRDSATESAIAYEQNNSRRVIFSKHRSGPALAVPASSLDVNQESVLLLRSWTPAKFVADSGSLRANRGYTNGLSSCAGDYVPGP